MTTLTEDKAKNLLKDILTGIYDAGYVCGETMERICSKTQSEQSNLEDKKSFDAAKKYAEDMIGSITKTIVMK